MHKASSDLQPTISESSEIQPTLCGASSRRSTEHSWLFFADPLVYKVKRPVKLNGRDYRTLDAREKACQREYRVNRAIAGEIYQEVVPLFQSGDSWSLEGTGEPCEYGIRMQLLPPERMLDRLIAENAVRTADLVALGEMLAKFFQSAKSGEKVARGGSVGNIEANIHTALKGVTEGGGDRLQVANVESALLQYLAAHRESFEKRVAQNKIRDGHGELGAGHICLTDPPVLFGRLEYSDRARHRDVLDDLAGLLIDLDLLGRADLSQQLWVLVAERLGERPDEPLLQFYKAYHSLQRARHEFLLSETKARGVRTLAQAVTYCQAFHQPRLFVAFGLMGSGKSTLAGALAQELGMRHFSATQMRENLFPAADPKAKPVRLNEEQIGQLYDSLCAHALESLRAGISVVLDADFLTNQHRALALETAHAAGVHPLFIECRISTNDAIARLDSRRRKNRTMARTRPELYEEQRERFEPIESIPSESLLPLNTNQPVPALVETVIKTAFGPSAK